MKDYYKEINEVLISYEQHKPYHKQSLDWVADRISWAWNWRHITERQMEELADRYVKVIKEY